MQVCIFAIFKVDVIIHLHACQRNVLKFILYDKENSNLNLIPFSVIFITMSNLWCERKNGRGEFGIPTLKIVEIFWCNSEYMAVVAN